MLQFRRDYCNKKCFFYKISEINFFVYFDMRKGSSQREQILSFLLQCTPFDKGLGGGKTTLTELFSLYMYHFSLKEDVPLEKDVLI